MTELSASKPVILVVDDSRLMRVAARKILKAEFDIEEAADGEIAWETLQTDGRITLMISDLSMPNMDGLELLKKIRASDDFRLRELPVIIVTGAEDDDGSKKTALAAGASDFITKPFDSVQLLARTQSQVTQQRTRKELEDSERVKQDLQQRIRVDSLTGLANAEAFSARLKEAVSYAGRHSTGLAVLQIRVDKYKVLFLRKGKLIAEQALCELARFICMDRRQEDIVARLSLDTFALLLPSASSAGALRIATAIHSGVEQLTVSQSEPDLRITISIAVSAPVMNQAITASRILEDGHANLMLAQEAGGNRVDVSGLPEPGESGIAIKPPAASPEDVRLALETIASGKTPQSDPDQIARAVLPVLRTWNDSRNRNFTHLLEEIEKALGPGENDVKSAESPVAS